MNLSFLVWFRDQVESVKDPRILERLGLLVSAEQTKERKAAAAKRREDARQYREQELRQKIALDRIREKQAELKSLESQVIISKFYFCDPKTQKYCQLYNGIF